MTPIYSSNREKVYDKIVYSAPHLSVTIKILLSISINENSEKIGKKSVYDYWKKNGELNKPYYASAKNALYPMHL